MHIEVLVEDSSGKRLLEFLLPSLIGDYGNPHTYRIISYRGIGHIPKGLHSVSDPAKRILLDRLPGVLQGNARTPGIDATLIVVDSDRRNCADFLQELHGVLQRCNPAPTALFRLAIEEIEAWYFGDRSALLEAYPNAKSPILNAYIQDSICDTWERLADAIYPGGSAALKQAGWPLPGQIKHEWAERIGPLLQPDRNKSPSFKKFREGLQRLVNEGSDSVATDHAG
jgi:hypothetical protein